MPGVTVMPVWAWIAIGIVGAALLAVAGYYLWRWAWFHLSKRYLVRLIGHRESVLASIRTIEAIMRHLADEPDEALIEFASNLESVDRKALLEVRGRAEMLRDDLLSIPLPAHQVSAAEALADVAEAIENEAGRVTEDMGAEEVLEALAAVDLGRIANLQKVAMELITRECDYYGIENPSVYGGGLYI